MTASSFLFGRVGFCNAFNKPTLRALKELIILIGSRELLKLISILSFESKSTYNFKFEKKIKKTEIIKTYLIDFTVK